MEYVFGIDVGGTTVKIGLPTHQTAAKPFCRMLLQVWKKK